jgi:hypothetical protein
MTNHVARLYVAAASVLVLFLAWAAIAAHPWPAKQSAAADPRIVALNARETALRAETVAVQRLLAVSRAQQARAATRTVAARSAPAAQPAVRIVTLPPLTITRTS